MPPWPKDKPLSPTQSPRPILWHLDLPQAADQHFLDQLPSVSDSQIADIFNDWPARTRRILTFGHLEAKNKHSAHFLITRRGLKMHTDPGYVRFTHHLVIRNDGLGIAGLAGPEQPMPRGTLYCLDSWSPHEVDWDPRLPRTGHYKAQLAIDADTPMDPDAVLEAIAPLFEIAVSR